MAEQSDQSDQSDQTDLFFSRSMERPTATSRTGRRPSLLTSALRQSGENSSSPPITHRTVVQRRSPPATGKPVVGESPSAETAFLTNHVQLNQPDGAPPPPSPHCPSQSQPIAIPIRRRHENSRPTTPLTAREEKGAYFPDSFDTIRPRPQISHSLRPAYKRPDAKEPNLNLVTHQDYLSAKALEQLKELSPLADTSQSMPSPTYRPSSPLSPPKTSSALSAGLQAQNGGRRGKELHLQPFPRYHPAHYQPPTLPKSTNITPRSSAVNRSPYTPQYHQRQATNVRQKLKQHQHEIIKAARAGPLPITPGGSDTPKAPQLQPRESPGLPTTPMMLDKQMDYMTAGLRDTQLGEGSPVSSRDMVDRIIRQENERRIGLHSNSSSPAISPAA